MNRPTLRSIIEILFVVWACTFTVYVAGRVLPVFTDPSGADCVCFER